MSHNLFSDAKNILQQNDRGSYTVPTNNLYPFQWNWDSCLTAIGFSYFDEARAWLEIETLFEHQWNDGMVPHIVFHKQDDGYFPGPDVWRVGRPVATSGITQPPVTAFVVRRLFERAKDKDLALKKVTMLLPKIAHWHRWFYDCRDLQRTGLVAILHPWESGRDNSIDWDQALEPVPQVSTDSYHRRDTEHANPQHRPTDAQYNRYLWLVEHFRSLEWDNKTLLKASPFQVVDPGFNAILLRSCSDLAFLARTIGEADIASEAQMQYDQGIQALEQLWSEQDNQYLCLDLSRQALIDSPSIGGLFPVFADAPHGDQIAKKIIAIGERGNYLVPSHDPRDTRFEGMRYWRGPVWLIANYFLYDGLVSAGHQTLAQQIADHSLALIKQEKFAEYFDPRNAQACGGSEFTWTAAMTIEFLQLAEHSQTIK